MGSYRRGAEDSGDVDILLTRDTSDGKTHAGESCSRSSGLMNRRPAHPFAMVVPQAHLYPLCG
jgi:hypothetical protein